MFRKLFAITLVSAAWLCFGLLLCCVTSCFGQLQQSAISQPTQRLIAAVLSNKLPDLKLALAEGADVNAADANGGTPLICATTGGFTSIAEFLIKNGANVNASEKQFGRTALWIAAGNDNI